MKELSNGCILERCRSFKDGVCCYDGPVCKYRENTIEGYKELADKYATLEAENEKLKKFNERMIDEIYGVQEQLKITEERMEYECDRLEAENEKLKDDLKVNAGLLAKQCDRAMELEAENVENDLNLCSTPVSESMTEHDKACLAIYQKLVKKGGAEASNKLADYAHTLSLAYRVDISDDLNALRKGA